MGCDSYHCQNCVVTILSRLNCIKVIFNNYDPCCLCYQEMGCDSYHCQNCVVTMLSRLNCIKVIFNNYDPMILVVCVIRR
jgi:hypothetical protein